MESRAESTSVVVCAGDSVTEGRVSGNFISLLSHQLVGYEFVNAGVGIGWRR